MSILHSAVNFLARLGTGLLPQSCVLCGASNSAEILCTNCSADLPRLPEHYCPHCATPTLSGETCGRCIAKPPHFDAALAAFCYAFPLNQLIQSFKYAHRLPLGAYLGQQLGHMIARQHEKQVLRGESPQGFDCIMPLPLHPLRLRERGFNQSLEIARILSKRFGWPINARDCHRLRQTPAQANLPWKERERSIRGAFHCKTDLQGQRIALLDDVMTSGASLNECARTLKLHGAAHVSALVVARTLPR